MARQAKIGVALSAGGAAAVAEIGVVSELVAAGIPIDFVAGTSAGAMVGAVYAAGRLPEFAATVRALTRRRVLALFDPKWPRGGLLEGQRAMSLLRPHVSTTFDSLLRPFAAVAADLRTGERVVLSEGSVFDAVRASIAIPYVWRPWKVGDRMLMDGCMSDPLPVDVAIREGAQIILAMAFESPFPRRIKSATRFAFQVNSVYTNNLLRANYAFHNLAHHTEIIPVLPEFDSEIGLFDTHKIPHVIEQGERATEAQLPYLQRLLDGIAV